MKKPLAMLLALTMAFTMAGCAGGSSTESKDSTASEDTAEAKENTDTEEAADASEDTDSEAGADVMSYDEYMAADLDSQVLFRLMFRQSSPGMRTKLPYMPRTRTAAISSTIWPARKTNMTF